MSKSVKANPYVCGFAFGKLDNEGINPNACISKRSTPGELHPGKVKNRMTTNLSQLMGFTKTNAKAYFRQPSRGPAVRVSHCELGLIDCTQDIIRSVHNSIIEKLISFL